MASAGPPLQQLRESVASIREETAAEPGVCIILGTGLGQLADRIEVETEIPYPAIPHFPIPTVETHSGKLIFGRLGGRSVVAMQGRFHLYEGYSAWEVTLPVRIMRLLGARMMVVSNACGGLNPLWSPGDLVLLDDHINLLGVNPLVGPNLDELGTRFPDMSEPYDRELQTVALEVALELGIALRRGVYAAMTGPNLETRAEYRMLQRIGADVIGMSTVPEVIVARHMDMRVLGVSIITDQCLPDALQPARIEEIIRIANQAQPGLTRLVEKVLERLPGEVETGTPAGARGG